MSILALDCGSSSVIAGVLNGQPISGDEPRTFFKTKVSGPRVEVDASEITRALRTSIGKLGAKAKKVDLIALAVMSPAWVAMDARGKALTPLITHQDRRSVEEARAIESRIGKARHLKLAGNRPYPGGISSTTWAWYQKHHPEVLKKADLVGHLNTFLHRRMTGERVTDPSNASFTGLYRTVELGGWSGELCEAVGAKLSQLPEVHDGDQVGGRINAAAAREFGLTQGTPMLVSVVDGSAGMLMAGAKVGQLFNVTGSTDVLALCTDKPRPREGVLTRALGVHGMWLSVCTLAAVASALYWAKAKFYREMPIKDFQKEMVRLAAAGIKASGTVRFEPYMAGERTSIEQRQGVFTGLTLASTREQMLSAMIEALVAASAARLPLLDDGSTPFLRSVVASGGASDRLDKLMHRDWPGRWTFKPVTEATMQGLWKLSEPFRNGRVN
jgi:xylulokinase